MVKAREIKYGTAIDNGDVVGIIKLTKNQFTIISPLDTYICQGVNWQAGYDSHINGYYARRTIGSKKNKKTIRLHRFILENYLKKELKSKEIIDHINNFSLDNRRINLRVVSNRQNTQNKKKKTSSKYIGVCWVKEKNKWRADIRIEGRGRHISYFLSEINAAKAYQMAQRLYYNEELVCKIDKKSSYKTNKKFTPIWELRR